MQLIADLTEKTPIDIKEKPEFKDLLGFISVNNLQNKVDLIKFLDGQIEEASFWLKNNNSTGISAIITISEKVAKLEKYKFLKQISQEYLK